MIKITQIKSKIKRLKNQKNTLKAIGLGKINKNIKVRKNNKILGMIKKIKHLIKIENL